GAPGGSEPHPRIHAAFGIAAVAERIASTSGALSAGPGSFTFVTVPSPSTRLTLIRIEPAVGTATVAVASARSLRYTVAESAASGSTAMVATPSAVRAHETLMPFPAASALDPLARIIAPRSRRPISIV